MPVQVLVLAKRPVAGRVKTRLTPPYSPDQATTLAAAALDDTLDVVAATPVSHRVLAFDGEPDGWRRTYSVVEQCGGGLDDRLTAAVRDAYELHDLPVLLVGMDTPQLRPDLLHEAARRLLQPGVDAVLGPATDGGFWLVGLRRPHPRAFAGVPMSRAYTCDAQLARLRQLGLRVRLLPQLTDVDDAASARAVAAAAPGTRFASVHAALAEQELVG
ncbi:MAG: DUF2064 domain-containing protein [Streptosporangiales bacterium]|nr:DUF2064 domain-containing protein [Streptosporangiales bacterium]